MASWRKNREGAWRVFGPAAEVAEGSLVTVKKRDGTSSRVRIGSVSRSFDVDGVPHVYGAPEGGSSSTSRSAGASSRLAAGPCAECGSPRGPFTPCTDSSGISGYCCPRCARMSRYERSFA